MRPTKSAGYPPLMRDFIFIGEFDKFLPPPRGDCDLLLLLLLLLRLL